LAPADIGDEPPTENLRESTLRKEVSRLKRVLAEKTVELDFFKGASFGTSHVALLRTGNAALRLRIEPELRNSWRLAPSSNA
jgi:hypothetical protein